MHDGELTAKAISGRIEVFRHSSGVQPLELDHTLAWLTRLAREGEPCIAFLRRRGRWFQRMHNSIDNATAIKSCQKPQLERILGEEGPPFHTVFKLARIETDHLPGHCCEVLLKNRHVKINLL